MVFKYLLEDETITVRLLSALLQKDVQDVTLRRNEYSDLTKQGVHLFRVDFAAHVREKDGSVHLVLIELQKSWVDTEILRFRQHLGVQYSSPDNMTSQEDRPENPGTGVPIVAVYILGHDVGDIEEPVLYVRRKYLDYDKNAVRQGVPDPFVESITHDSIIVQIPRLGTRQDNPLTRLLSIFDQSRKTADNHHILKVDEASYGRDTLERRIMDRLTAAAADPEVRRIMMIEGRRKKPHTAIGFLRNPATCLSVRSALNVRTSHDGCDYDCSSGTLACEMNFGLTGIVVSIHRPDSRPPGTQPYFITVTSASTLSKTEMAE